jgi:hypothetical protein
LKHQNNSLRDINGWLGWGDPQHALWFIGIEEGAEFSPAKVAAMRGQHFQPVDEVRDRNTPVAIRTAKIACGLTGVEDVREYRRSRMGWRGSKVFNGNLFPLGKRSLSAWPSKYDRLLGVTRTEYLAQREALYTERAELFKRFRAIQQPQAVICFGKACWKRFEEVFVGSDTRPARPHPRLDIIVYNADRVILTPHFCRGTLMPNRAVASVIEILKRWNVRLPM